MARVVALLSPFHFGFAGAQEWDIDCFYDPVSSAPVPPQLVRDRRQRSFLVDQQLDDVPTCSRAPP
jgi:hypothetical protein